MANNPQREAQAKADQEHLEKQREEVRKRSMEDQARIQASRVTPTAEEANLARQGMPLSEHAPSGAPPQQIFPDLMMPAPQAPAVTTEKVDEKVEKTTEKTAEARPAQASYETRTMSPSPRAASPRLTVTPDAEAPKKE